MTMNLSMTITLVASMYLLVGVLDVFRTADLKGSKVVCAAAPYPFTIAEKF